MKLNFKEILITGLIAIAFVYIWNNYVNPALGGNYSA